MFQAIISGNLGADAEIVKYNGNEFLSFRIAHNDSYVNSKGEQVDKTTWIRVTYNGKSDNLIKYLKRGQQVLVIGRESVSCYSSPKLKRFVGSAEIIADRIELVGSINSDIVPSQLFTADGVAISVNKTYWVKPADIYAATSLVFVKGKTETLRLVDRRRNLFEVNLEDGSILPIIEDSEVLEEAKPESNTEAL